MLTRFLLKCSGGMRPGRDTEATTKCSSPYPVPATYPRLSQQDAVTELNRFPFNNFKDCLTLFSKFFASFLHSTCSLSELQQYLALDGRYHPFWVAIPRNPTLDKTNSLSGQPIPPPLWVFHPLWSAFPMRLRRGRLTSK